MSLDDRTRLLINQNNLDKLSKIKVLVVGLGGVGSIVPISLVRSGVKNITIIDKDKVEVFEIAYDEHWIQNEYLPRLVYLAECLKKRKTPNKEEFERRQNNEKRIYTADW